MRPFLVLLAALFIASPLAGQALFDVPHPTDVASWEVEADTAFAGADAALVVRVRLDGDWRMYAMGTAAGKPLTVKFDSTRFFSPAPEVVQEGVEVGYDPNFDTDVTYFTEASRLRVPLSVAPHAPAGAHAVPGTIEFMLCNDRVCLPPTTIAVEPVVVVAAR